MATITGATWRGTYSSYYSYFRVFCTYTWEPNYSVTQARLVISSIGIQRTSGNSAVEMVASAPKSATITLTGQTSTTFNKEGTAYKWGESSTAEKSFGSKTYIINKGNAAKSLTFTVSAKKDSGAWSGSSSKSVTLSMPAQTGITIHYDGNAPTGLVVSNTPVDQVAGTSTTVTLSSTKPSCSGYTFLGWSTSSGASNNVNYSSGDTTYQTGSTVNTTETLYAVWFKPPTLSNATAYRVATDATGTSPSVVDGSERGFFKCSYTPPINYRGTITFSIKFGSTTFTPTLSGSTLYRYTNNTTCPTGIKTDIVLTITVPMKSKTNDTSNTYTISTFISAEAMAMDVFRTNEGVFNMGFGRSAVENSYVYVQNSANFYRQRLDMDSEIMLDIDSNAAYSTDTTLNTLITNFGWTDVLEDD